MLLPSVLSEAAPNYSRTLPSLPATFVAAGLGLTWIVTYAWPVRWLGPAIAATILLFSTGSTIYDYFVRFAQSEEVYYLYDARKSGRALPSGPVHRPGRSSTSHNCGATSTRPSTCCAVRWALNLSTPATRLRCRRQEGRR